MKCNDFPQKKKNQYKLSIDVTVNGIEDLAEIGILATGQGEFKFMAALVCRKFCTNNVEFVELEAVLGRVKMAKDAELQMKLATSQLKMKLLLSIYNYN